MNTPNNPQPSQIKDGDPLGLFAWRDGEKDFSRAFMALDLLNGEDSALLANEEIQAETPTAQ